MKTPTPHIICCDDDPDDQFLFSAALKELQEGIPYTLCFVNDGDELWHLLEQMLRLPDVLFLDVNMPRRNGLECLLQIRASARYDSMPVVILSTTEDRSVVESAFCLGATLYATKASSYERFRNVLGVCLFRALTVPMETVKETFVVRG